MPGGASFLRLVYLLAFIGAVAVFLWLIQASWPVVVVVMALAWAIAAGIEWVSWQEEHPFRSFRRERRERRDERRLPASVAAEERRPEEPTPEPAARAVPQEDREQAPETPEPVTAEAPEPAEPEPEEAVAPPAEPVAPLAEPEPEDRPSEAPAPPAPAPPRPVPAPPPARPEPPPRPAARPSGVVPLAARRAGAREWNLWELERLARAESQRDPERSRERAYLFVHLRQFARADGTLPVEFDSLVRESFGDLIEASRSA